MSLTNHHSIIIITITIITEHWHIQIPKSIIYGLYGLRKYRMKIKRKQLHTEQHRI